MARLVMVLVFLAGVLSSGPTFADFIDLSSWTAMNLNLPGGQGLGDWSLTGGDLIVWQNEDCDPSFFLNNLYQSTYIMHGHLGVGASTDDDLIGFVFNFQDPGHCYILDWKQTQQNASGYGMRDEGFCLRKMHGPASDMTLADYWSHIPFDDDYTILAVGFGPEMGWVDGYTYNFTLSVTPGSFTVVVDHDGTVIWDATIEDGTYTSGRFGFYNFSQRDTEYSYVTQDGLPQCDAGGPYFAVPGETVDFDGTGSSDPDGEVTAWNWDFGDGSTSEGPTPQHVYAGAGTYPVRLIVADDDGQTSTCWTTATVTPLTAVPDAPTTDRETLGTVKSLFR